MQKIWGCVEMALKENRTFRISEPSDRLFKSYQAYRREHMAIEQSIIKRIFVLIGLVGISLIGLTLLVQGNLGIRAFDLFIVLLSLLVGIRLFRYWKLKKLNERHQDLMQDNFFKYLTQGIIRGNAEQSDKLMMTLCMMEVNNLNETIYSSNNQDIVIIREYK